jgi:hypothetical protein
MCYSQHISVLDKINQSENFIKQAMAENPDYYFKRVEITNPAMSPYNKIYRILYFNNMYNSNNISFKIDILTNKCTSIISTEDIDSLPQLLKLFNNTSDFNEMDTMKYEDVEGRFKVRIEETNLHAIVYIDVLKYY